MKIKITELTAKDSNINAIEFTELKNVKGGQEAPLPDLDNINPDDLPGFIDPSSGLLDINPNVYFDPSTFENFGGFEFIGFTPLPSF